jgi:hypothetical protein
MELERGYSRRFWKRGGDIEAEKIIELLDTQQRRQR